MARNMFAGLCQYCAMIVEARAGRFAKRGDKWVISHVDCDDRWRRKAWSSVAEAEAAHKAYVAAQAKGADNGGT